MAINVGCARAANIQKVRSVGCVHHTVDARSDTNILVHMGQSFIWHNAAFFAGARQRRHTNQQ